MPVTLSVIIAILGMVCAPPPPLTPGNYLFNENDAHGMVTCAIVVPENSETNTLRLVVSSPIGVAQGIVGYRIDPPMEPGTRSRVNLIWRSDEHRRDVAESINELNIGFDLDINDALTYMDISDATGGVTLYIGHNTRISLTFHDHPPPPNPPTPGTYRFTDPHGALSVQVVIGDEFGPYVLRLLAFSPRSVVQRWIPYTIDRDYQGGTYLHFHWTEEIRRETVRQLNEMVTSFEAVGLVALSGMSTNTQGGSLPIGGGIDIPLLRRDLLPEDACNI